MPRLHWCLPWIRVPSPLGRMLVVSDTTHRLRALNWEDREERMERELARIYRRQPRATRVRHGAGRDPSRPARYFAGKLQAIDEIPVQTGGTPFQSNVWRALRTIPAGTTLSYGRMAHRAEVSAGGARGRLRERLESRSAS